MDVWRRGPAEPEERDDVQGAAETREWDSAILLDKSPGSVGFLCALEDVVVVYEDAQCRRSTNEDGDECEAGFSCVHVIDALENEWVGFKEEVEDCVGEGEV